MGETRSIGTMWKIPEFAEDVKDTVLVEYPNVVALFHWKLSGDFPLPARLCKRALISKYFAGFIHIVGVPDLAPIVI